MAFPNIEPLNGVKISSIGKTVKTSFDGNYTQQRLKASRILKSFEMTYLLSASEFDTLDTFFQDTLGSSFVFNNPATDEAFTVRFDSDQLDATYMTNELVKVTLKLMEV
jgi:hypothetical protein